jgi:hypothetical protein
MPTKDKHTADLRKAFTTMVPGTACQGCGKIFHSRSGHHNHKIQVKNHKPKNNDLIIDAKYTPQYLHSTGNLY